MFEPDKITRNGAPSNGSAQKDTPLREASKPLMLQGKMWVIASWRGGRDRDTRQIGIECQIELGGTALDPAQHQVLDGIKAKRSQPERLPHSPMDVLQAEGLQQA